MFAKDCVGSHRIFARIENNIQSNISRMPLQRLPTGQCPKKLTGGRTRLDFKTSGGRRVQAATWSTAFRVQSSAHDDAQNNESDLNSVVSEELIARLKAAEEEAKELKQKLNQVQQERADSNDVSSSPQKRIDGADLRRETLSFVENKPRNWLSESDIEFFTGGGPGEVGGNGKGDQTEEEAAVVKRRLLIGTLLSIGLGAFALIPTEKLQPPPSKPLFFYLVPLLRVKEILQEIVRVIPDGNYEQLGSLLSRIEGPPNNVQENLKAAAASLPDGKLAERADFVARDVFEYIKGIDYQTYFESVGGSGKLSTGGQQAKEMFEYSENSAKAAQKKLDEFLSLMPADQLEAAQQQLF